MPRRKTLLTTAVLPVALGLAVAGCATDGERQKPLKEIGYMCSPLMICGPTEPWGHQTAGPCNPCAVSEPCSPCAAN